MRKEPKKCGTAPQNLPEVNIEAGGFTNKIKCGCLEATVFHEMLHNANVKTHYEIEKITLKCFPCGRWHDPKKYPDYDKDYTDEPL